MPAAGGREDGDTRAGPAYARARAALAAGDARRAVDLADLGLNGARDDDERPPLLRVRAAAQLALGRAKDAHASAARALAIARDEHAETLGLAAAAAAVLGRHDEAAAGFERAAMIDPSSAQWAAGHATALLALGRHARAAAAAESALLADARNVDARLVLGALAMRAGDPRAAVSWLAPAAERAPTRADVRATLAVALAASGAIEEGLREYEWRNHLPGWNARPFDIPPWTGQPLAGTRLLVWDEQGLGDTIQFARFAEPARARGAHTIFHGQPSLCRLLGSARGFDAVVPRHQPRPAADWQAPLMSLPARLDLRGEEIAGAVPYLAAEPALVARWAARLGTGGPRRLVGLAWQGNPAFCDDERRSLPLRALLPVVRAFAGRFRFVSLQKGFGHDQLQLLPAGVAIDDLGADLDQHGDAFVDSAAVLERTELLITSDTAIAHLAGALGRPVWLLLARVPDWRWGVDGAVTPWYPTMRLFRQKTDGDWAGPIAEIERALSAC